VRVVVTRPEHSARRTAGRLQALGHEPVLLPLTKAVHHPEIAEGALKQPHTGLAITSAEAVRVLALLGGKLTPHLGEAVYAVGEATAKAVGESGFRYIRTGSGTGAGLAELVASDAPQFAATLLYLAGKPRSPKFEEGLRARNLSFATAEIYEMTPIAYDDGAIRDTVVDPPADAVLLYSRESARLFSDLVAPHAPALAAMRFFCLSANVAEAVRTDFHRNIKIADHPDEGGLFALL